VVEAKSGAGGVRRWINGVIAVGESVEVRVLIYRVRWMGNSGNIANCKKVRRRRLMT
jgi:hypothetical protein